MELPWLLLASWLAAVALGQTWTTSNDQILQKEIETALKGCSFSEEEGLHEFLKRSSRDRRSMESGRRAKRNLNLVMEQINDFLKERSLEDSGSGEWDYGGGGNKKSTWETGNEDKSSLDNIYQHDRRNKTGAGSYGTGQGNSSLGNNGRNSSYGSNGGDDNVQEQNSTRHNQNQVENNFDSRGARLRPMADYPRNNRKSFRSEHKWAKKLQEGVGRMRRAERLSRAAANLQCLSECVFTNLGIVDDRGIPKEDLFLKLIQNAITSQQMKAIIEKHAKHCFHGLATESQDDSCLYSNALEKCLGLELKRRINNQSEETDATLPTPE